MADFATATQHVEAASRRQVRRGKLLLLDVSERQWRDAMQINPQAVTHTQTAHREKGEAWEWDAAGRRIRRSTMQSSAPSPDMTINATVTLFAKAHFAACLST